MYRPNTPPLANIDLFMSTIIQIHDTISLERKVAYLMGDYNINLLDLSNEPKIKRLHGQCDNFITMLG